MDNKYDYLKYRPTMVGKIAMYIATPAAITGIIAVFFAFKLPQAFIVTLIAEAIAFLGGIVLTIDIVRFNIRSKKEQEAKRKNSKLKNDPTQMQPKQMDIYRIVHMLIGIAVGIIIGYLIWH